jgi:hypothetical protein
MIESGSVRRALSRVRDEISPTRDDKARLRARILAPAVVLAPEGAGQAATAPARAAPLTPWAALKAAGSVGAAAGLALLGIGGGMGFWLGHEVASSRARSAAAFERPAPAVEAPPRELDRSAGGPPASTTPAAPSEPVADVVAASAAASAEASEARREPHPSDVPPRAHPARQRARPNPLDAELALLRRVERALRNDDPSLARALLGELDERFPDSRLAEERSAARRIADCRSGEPGASESARTFLREHGASVYRKRIARACALEGEKGSTPAPMTNSESADTHVR